MPDTVALDQPFDADGLYPLRAAVAAHAAALGASADRTEDLLIVAGELATNAIRHGGGSGRLRLWRAGASLVCRVEDNGEGIADPEPGTHRPPATAAGGRGLWIARHLADQLIIGGNGDGDGDGGGGGATVTAVLPLAAGGSTASDPPR